MSIYIKSGGAWVEKTGRPHVKKDGLWMPVKEGYVKRSGVWTEFYNYDVTPPATPQIQLTEVNPQYNAGGALRLGRYINVSVAPAVVDETLKRLVVLVSTSYQPSSPYDAQSFISAPGFEAPGEPWSEIGYNGYLTSRALVAVSNKRFTANQADSTVLPGGTYYVSVFAQDWAGNWSDGAYDNISLSNSFDVTQRTSHSASIRPGQGGSYVAGTYDWKGEGDMTYDVSPMTHGVWFYNGGVTVNSSILTAPVNNYIESMQIYLVRKANDAATANSGPIYLFPHAYASGGALEGNPLFYNAVNVGSLSKGEGKWFNVPTDWWYGFATGTLKGMGVASRNVGMTSFVRGSLKSRDQAPRQGEIALTWSSEASA